MANKQWKKTGHLIFCITINTIKRIIGFPNNTCRFYPSCSEYAYEALDVYSPIKATGMIVKRLVRCNPFSKGGFDPVITQQKKDITA